MTKKQICTYSVIEFSTSVSYNDNELKRGEQPGLH